MPVHVVYYETEDARNVGYKDLKAKGYQVRLYDLTEMSGPDYAIQARPMSEEGMKWPKMIYKH